MCCLWQQYSLASARSMVGGFTCCMGNFEGRQIAWLLKSMGKLQGLTFDCTTTRLACICILSPPSRKLIEQALGSLQERLIQDRQRLAPVIEHFNLGPGCGRSGLIATFRPLRPKLQTRQCLSQLLSWYLGRSKMRPPCP